MKNFMFIFLVLTSATVLQAQTSLKGIVVDNNTNIPLQGVTVCETANPKNCVTTNEEGRYWLPLTQSPAAVRFSFTGYGAVVVEGAAGESTIRLTPLNGHLTEVVVVGFQNYRKLLDVAGAVNVIKSADLQRGDLSTIATALNAIPGVRMEEHGPGGSARISIRGSVLRSPYGVRGIKVYWNDIPYTSAGGSTPYALFDPSVIGSIEVLKGPAGSMYGAGTGGILLMSARKPPKNEQSVEISFLTGSYGLRRYGAQVNSHTDKVQVSAVYNEQSYEGYRYLQSTTYRKVLNIQSRFNISEKHNLTINAFNTRANFDLPGSLSKTMFATHPRHVDAMVDTLDGRVTTTVTNIAVSNQYIFSDKFSNTTSLYTAINSIDHPFGTSPFNASYGKANGSSLGGRTRFVYTPTAKPLIRINAGAEFQRDIDAEKSFTNEKGKPGSLTGLYDFTTLQYFFFTNAEINLPKSFILTIGASYNRLHYTIEDLYNPPGNIDESQKLSFKGDLSPRIALLKKINSYHSVFGSISAGFGPPTPSELSVAGVTNTGLRSERGTNYEIGARGRSKDGRFQYDLNLYQFNLKNIIISTRLASGVDRYDNAGSADQRGIELLLDYDLIANDHQWINGVKFFGNFTYNDYRFDAFVQKNEQDNTQADHSGNYLPGIPDYVAAGGFDLTSKSGFYINGTFQHFGRRYITNDNAEKSDGYQVVNGRIGYRQTWKKISLNLFTGINNILDEMYSEFLAINGFGGNYYLPSPGRNYYGGISIKYSFNQ